MFKKIDPFVRGEKALSVFHEALGELEKAVEDHHAQADEKYAQSHMLALDAAGHKSAAANHSRRIIKIAEFLA